MWLLASGQPIIGALLDQTMLPDWV